jgi:hypothetical protein
MDLDRHPQAGLIDKLSELSGLAPALLEQATLYPIAQLVLSAEPPNKQSWPWILPVGSRNRRRVGRMQYCPLCLAADERPFFRLQWRFAWHALCARHECQLLDACPHCNATLEPHRVQLGGNGLDVCMNCNQSLSREVSLQPALPGAQFLQQATDDTLRARQMTYLNEVVSVPGWFAVIRFYIDLVRRALRTRTLSMEALALGFPEEIRNCLGFVPLEKLTLRQRARLLDCAGRYMLMPFEHLVSEFSAVGLSRQAAFPSGVPDDVQPLKLIAAALPGRVSRPAGGCRHKSCSSQFRPRSPREVEHMMKVLRRRTAVDSGS